ncbi:MAG: type II secretion system F family protein [Candidatus Pseudoruminococcus sp.]|uniref:hypothetical protein n=1 Tax=Candidatus Pseudoruminococcus sp. TaxID=3101048 RepID=UPI002A7721BB|nr:type II secretion system F family protein [Ruminococcus sp.]MDY2782876.1 type II secretion system F family protein [Candidatus Pseudoruminococcus sp.]
MRLVEMIIGTILAILLIVQILRSGKYKKMTEGLSGDDYPLKGTYGIGFAWSSMKLFALRDRMREELIGQAKLLQDPQYAEYYAEVAWAQAITFAHISFTLGFLLSGMFDFTLFAFIGIAFGAFSVYYFLNNMKNILKKRSEECVYELPEIVSNIALLMNSGMVLKDVWQIVADSKEGEIYTLMKSSCEDMRNGMSEKDAIYKFGVLSNSGEIKKFTSALIQGIDQGSRDLTNILAEQSVEMLSLKKQIMLQKGEAAASKLLLPISLIFFGILIIVLTAAFGMLI